LKTLAYFFKKIETCQKNVAFFLKNQETFGKRVACFLFFSGRSRCVVWFPTKKISKN